MKVWVLRAPGGGENNEAHLYDFEPLSPLARQQTAYFEQIQVTKIRTRFMDGHRHIEKRILIPRDKHRYQLQYAFILGLAKTFNPRKELQPTLHYEEAVA